MIGQYTECSFRLAGKGTFFATDATNPTVGQKGRREDVDEWRLEVVVPEAIVAACGRGDAEGAQLRGARLRRLPAEGRRRAAARGGSANWRAASHWANWWSGSKQTLSAASVQVVGDLSRTVSRVAVACGAAGEYLVDSIRSNADVFLTGEMRFHDALTARDAGC